MVGKIGGWRRVKLLLPVTEVRQCGLGLWFSTDATNGAKNMSLQLVEGLRV
jgi:hypothetical protein